MRRAVGVLTQGLRFAFSVFVVFPIMVVTLVHCLECNALCECVVYGRENSEVGQVVPVVPVVCLF